MNILLGWLEMLSHYQMLWLRSKKKLCLPVIVKLLSNDAILLLSSYRYFDVVQISGTLDRSLHIYNCKGRKLEQLCIHCFCGSKDQKLLTCSICNDW